MFREIKFEYGFESVNGIIKKVYHLHQIPNIKEICDCWNVLPLAYVRLFTGLQDKHGVDIYEGDILRDWTVVDGELFGSMCTVFFDKGVFWLDLTVKQNRREIEYLTKELELFIYDVLGNIYENPELLNKEVTNV